jgi:hypothetical protein
MDADKSDATTTAAGVVVPTSGVGKPPAASATEAAAAAAAPASSEEGGEDFLIFGSRPSRLFDDVSSAIDVILAEEVSSLPLLPKTLTGRERREYRELRQRQQQQQQRNGGGGGGGGIDEEGGEGGAGGGGGGKEDPPPPMTGEERLLSRLRGAYKKNLDIAEAYCHRNIFTVGYYPKTKRRLIL